MPAPTPEDHATAQAFYDVVRAIQDTSRRPLIALRPAHAYLVAGQPVGLDGTGFQYQLAARAPGASQVLQSIQDLDVSQVIIERELGPRNPALAATLVERYRIVAACALGYDFGRSLFYIFVPRRSTFEVVLPPGVRCSGATPPPPGFAAHAPPASPARAEPR
jgi:hypothetical protein